MKSQFLPALLCGVLAFLSACRKKESAPASGPPKPPEFASSENNLGYINEGIRNFQQTKNRLPADLNELVAEKLVAHIPSPPPGFVYVMDRKSGQVTLLQNQQQK
ncbi:MAG: hypothetical protein HZA92_15390 [Verrucomicrobia bacterium]|nr:hypothetical protein [Verrucomicrobiota bacterium]